MCTVPNVLFYTPSDKILETQLSLYVSRLHKPIGVIHRYGVSHETIGSSQKAVIFRFRFARIGCHDIMILDWRTLGPLQRARHIIDAVYVCAGKAKWAWKS